MWNCLWGNALKRSPGIIRKSRVSYPGPGFLSSASWPSLPKKHYNGLNQTTELTRPQTYDRYSGLNTPHSMYLNWGTLSVECESWRYRVLSIRDNFRDWPQLMTMIQHSTHKTMIDSAPYIWKGNLECERMLKYVECWVSVISLGPVVVISVDILSLGYTTHREEFLDTVCYCGCP